MKNKRRRSPARLLVAAIILFLSSAFIVLGLKELAELKELEKLKDWKPITFIKAVVVPLVF